MMTQGWTLSFAGSFPAADLELIFLPQSPISSARFSLLFDFLKIVFLFDTGLRFGDPGL